MWPFKKEKKKKRKYTRKNTPQKIYSKEEKLIREFEQTGAPITVFCNMGRNAQRRTAGIKRGLCFRNSSRKYNYKKEDGQNSIKPLIL